MNCKVFTLILIAFFVSYKGFSQERKKEIVTAPLTLPDSYYKGQEEKRKFADKNKVGVVTSGTATTTYPSKNAIKETEDSPETKAKKLLNTSVVPADFPKYKNTMSAKEYEAEVAEWFRVNPSYRKVNK